MSSTLSRFVGWQQEAHAKIAAILIRPAPAPGAPSSSVSAEPDAYNDLSGVTPGALPQTAADTHLYQAVTAVITKVLGGRIGTSEIKGMAERVATVVVERGWHLVNGALKDPEIHKAAVNAIKRVLIETAYIVGGRCGGLLMARGADYFAERIIQALNAHSIALSSAPQVLPDWEVEDARPGGPQLAVGADRDAPRDGGSYAVASLVSRCAT